MDITDIGECWLNYSLSADGTELRLRTERGEVLFAGIEEIAISPASSALQRQDDHKEIHVTRSYVLLENTVDAREFFGPLASGVIAVIIGPPAQPLIYNNSDKKRLRNLRGYSFDGNYLSFTVICRPFVFTPLPLGDQHA